MARPTIQSPRAGSGFVSAGSMVSRPTVSTTQGRIPGRRVLPAVSNRALPTMSRPAAPIPSIRRTTPSTSTAAAAASQSRTSSPISIIRSAADKASEDCLKELQAMRQRIQARKNIRNPGAILTDTGLKSIVSDVEETVRDLGCTNSFNVTIMQAKKLPVTDRELMLITNMKEEVFKNYGRPFLEISKKYFAAQNTDKT